MIPDLEEVLRSDLWVCAKLDHHVREKKKMYIIIIPSPPA